MNEKEILQPTHNIKQLGFSGLRGFGSRFSILVGGQERSPKTQPFHIANVGMHWGTKKIFTYSNTYPQNENNYTITPFLPIF
jgi:hypothetical protein